MEKLINHKYFMWGVAAGILVLMILSVYNTSRINKLQKKADLPESLQDKKTDSEIEKPDSKEKEDIK